MNKVCLKCKAELAEDVKFCSSCGTSQIGNNLCGKCGGVLKVSDVFCAQCGAQVHKNRDTIAENITVIAAKNNIEKVNNISTLFQRFQKEIIIILAIVAIVGAGAGGYFYNQYLVKSQAQAKKVQAKQVQEEALRTAENVERAKQANKDLNKKIGIQLALDSLNQNEVALKDMADRINAGTPARYFNSNRPLFLNRLREATQKVNEYFASNEEELKEEVREMVEIQVLRAEMMYKGLNIDKAYFAIGGQYYDDFYVKFNAFKAKYGVI